MPREKKGYSSPGEDFKYEVLDITTNIILTSKTALLSKEKSLIEILAWGGVIETFDSFIGIYYANDSIYTNTRNRIKHIALTINYENVGLKNKLYLKRAYDLWFRLICIKLAHFKIFPPLPYSYAQGIGEITEEIRLMTEKSEDE